MVQELTNAEVRKLNVHHILSSGSIILYIARVQGCEETLAAGLDWMRCEQARNYSKYVYN